jgi:hypothetical protein
MICYDPAARIKTMAEVSEHLDSIVSGMDGAGEHPAVDEASGISGHSGKAALSAIQMHAILAVHLPCSQP